MLSKNKIRTTCYDGIDAFVLQNRKKGGSIHFATQKVAEKNAEKYSKLLGQSVTVFERIYPAGRSFVLTVEKHID